METRIDAAKRLRTHVIRGAVRMPEIQAYLAELFFAADFDPSFPALWDIREAVFPGVTQEEVKGLAYFLNDHWTAKYQRKMAVVAGGDFHFGLSRMLEQFTGPSAKGKFRTFREPRVALEWLADQMAPPPRVVD